MATLFLDRDGARMERRPAMACSLRAWLGGDWGLLFSHPDDFAQYDVEADRWLVLLRDAFAASRVHPIALGSPSSAGASGWLAHVNGASARVSLAETSSPTHIADFQQRALRETIERSTARFVMMIDHRPRLRRTFEYSVHDRRPSLFDLIATAVKVRTGIVERSVHVAAPSRARARPLRSCAK
jgi:hypothetical protein